MPEDLQALLDRIQDEGVKEADAERDRILKEAKEEAERLLSQAKEDGEKIRSDAQHEADLLKQKGEEALRQAARDTLLSLRRQLEERIKRIAKATAGEALTDKDIASLVVELAHQAATSEDEDPSVEVLLPAEKAESLQKGLLQQLRSELKKTPELKPVDSLEGGFQVRFEGEDMLY
ncbi:MAG: hypothetical protein ACOCWJ_04635, partial [Verrucomicrobiota bacterium]